MIFQGHLKNTPVFHPQNMKNNGVSWKYNSGISEESKFGFIARCDKSKSEIRPDGRVKYTLCVCEIRISSLRVKFLLSQKLR